MKNLLIALFLLTCATAFAAAPTCTITNTSNCPVYYRLVMSAVNDSPACTVGAISALIAIAPGGSVTYNSSTVPGVAPAARYFLGARVYDGPTACITAAIEVGDACFFTSLTGSLNVKKPDCSPCLNISATWTPSTVLGAPCSLAFN